MDSTQALVLISIFHSGWEGVCSIPILRRLGKIRVTYDKKMYLFSPA